MADQLLMGTLDGWDVAVAYALTADTVNAALTRHDCDPAGGHVLGRALTAGVLAAASLGEGQRLNLRWAYEGLLRTVVVDSGPDGATRAFIAPPHLAEAGDEGALYGAGGTVQVIRSRKGAVVAHGTTRADLLEPVEDLAHFLCLSDQVESALASPSRFPRTPRGPRSCAAESCCRRNRDATCCASNACATGFTRRRCARCWGAATNPTAWSRTCCARWRRMNSRRPPCG
jgi:hypothetical protein